MPNAGKLVQKLDHSCTVGGYVKWYSHFGKACGSSLQSYIRANCTVGQLTWKNENACYTKTYRGTFTEALFIIARNGKLASPSLSRQLNTLWGIHVINHCPATEMSKLLVATATRRVSRELCPVKEPVSKGTYAYDYIKSGSIYRTLLKGHNSRGGFVMIR